MPIKIKVECDPDEYPAYEIRALFCDEAARKPTANRNPLTETPFNELLKKISQTAFDEGRRFEQTHPELKS